MSPSPATDAAAAGQELPAVATSSGLRAALALVADEGWDGPAGRAVLRYARDRIVRPQVQRVGLRGAAADQAVSTGWAAAWQVLDGGLAGAGSPWGVVAVAVRRAVLGEVLAGAYGTTERTAWRLRSAAVPTPVSFTALPDEGHELAAAARDSSSDEPAIRAVTGLMVEAGWREDDVRAVLDWVADRLGRTRRGGGWRALAGATGLPVWQARRALTLLVGAPGWPGLVERVVRGGIGALASPQVAAAVRATVQVADGSPERAARSFGDSACRTDGAVRSSALRTAESFAAIPSNHFPIARSPGTHCGPPRRLGSHGTVVSQQAARAVLAWGGEVVSLPCGVPRPCERRP